MGLVPSRMSAIVKKDSRGASVIDLTVDMDAMKPMDFVKSLGSASARLGSKASGAMSAYPTQGA